MAAWGLVAAIRLYRWAAGRIRWSRRCLFATSCSRYAERVARQEGAGVAVHAIRARFAACRPGYSFEFGEAGWQVRCVDGSAIDCKDASAAVHAEAAACLSVLHSAPTAAWAMAALMSAAVLNAPVTEHPVSAAPCRPEPIRCPR